MKIIKDMVGEYIYVTTKTYKPTAFFYKDKKLIRQLEIKSLKEFVNDIFNKIGISDCTFLRYINDNEHKIKEIVLDKRGIVKFTEEL